MTGLQTEFTFRLPKGFVDAAGTLHRDGFDAVCDARRDRTVAGSADRGSRRSLPHDRHPRTGHHRLGTITDVGPEHIEALFAADLAHLQELYGVANFGEPEQIQALEAETAARLAEDAALAAPTRSLRPTSRLTVRTSSQGLLQRLLVLVFGAESRRSRRGATRDHVPPRRPLG